MNHEHQLGAPVEGWSPPPAPTRATMDGRWCRLEPLDPGRHGAALFAANDGDDAMWDYMYDGPFADLAAYLSWARRAAEADDPLFFTIIDNADDQPKGVASYLRITPASGVIEVGNIAYAPALRRTRAATEAMHLMMRHAFELGYRRYEWKCNAFNAPSRRLAMRLGLSFEGVFRQHLVVKGRNRDTAWYATIDKEWPALDAALRCWLAPDNFDDDGQQRQSLSALTRPLLVNIG